MVISGNIYVYIQLNFTTIKAMQEGITHNHVVKSAKRDQEKYG